MAKKKRSYKKHDYIYMMVTNDELSLPLYVADSAKELGECVGIHPNHINWLISNNRTSKEGYKFIKVDVFGVEDDKEFEGCLPYMEDEEFVMTELEQVLQEMDDAGF